MSSSPSANSLSSSGDRPDPHGLGERGASRSALSLLSYGLAVLGMALNLMTPMSISLALRVGQIDPLHRDASYSLLSGIGTLVMLVGTPLAGQLSDATSSRLGPRKPWILFGTIGTWLCAVAMANMSNVGGLIVVWCLMTVCLCLHFPPLIAVIKDEFPEHQHGLASAFAGLSPFAGVLIGGWLVQAGSQSPTAMFVVPATVGTLCVLQFFFFPIRARSSGSSRFSFARFLHGFRFDPRANKPFAWLLLVFALSACGTLGLQVYLAYIVQDSLKVPSSELASATFQAILACNGMAAILSLASGIISDRMGRRKPLYVVGVLLLSAGLVLQVLSRSKFEFLAGSVVAGTGYGLFNGLLWAIAAEVMHNPETSARDMGLVNVAITIPGATIPFLAPTILRLHPSAGYAPLYLMCATVTALSVPLLRLVRGVR